MLIARSLRLIHLINNRHRNKKIKGEHPYNEIEKGDLKEIIIRNFPKYNIKFAKQYLRKHKIANIKFNYIIRILV